MRVSTRPRTARRLALIVGLAVLGGGVLPAVPGQVVVPVTSASAATLRLPDLRIARMRDFRIEKHGSRRSLRFTSTMWNQGAGPFVTAAHRASTAKPWVVDQIVTDSAGTTHRIRTDATLKYAGDGHDHWHVRKMMTYHLWGTTGTFNDAKIGFCFFDTNLIDGTLPRSPSHRVYQESGCGHRGALHTRTGISVGWADRYPWNFAFQWIDITGLPAGTYTIRGAVDLYGSFTEKSETNNCAWARIHFAKTGSAVKVLARGTACVNDWSTSAYAADIAWARADGISAGCDADMFCTNDVIDRGPAAAFLARALKLAPVATDHFTDDDGSFEARIDELAEAGIAAGCTATRFCPGAALRHVTTATWLANALALPDATQDYFDDDTGNPAEADINRLAEAGVADACGERRFCPGAKVSRGQLAALLHRAFGADGP